MKGEQIDGSYTKKNLMRLNAISTLERLRSREQKLEEAVRAGTMRKVVEPYNHGFRTRYVAVT